MKKYISEKEVRDEFRKDLKEKYDKEHFCETDDE